MLNILHMASHLINIGDGAIHYGTRKYFAASAKEKKETVRFINLDVVTLDLKRRLLETDDLTKGNFDTILVGGGGSIDGFRNKPCGISMPLMPDQVRDIEVPMLFWTLGENVFRGQEWHEDAKDNLNNLIDICRDKGWPFTVRADGSLGRLESVLTQSNHDHLVELPDPGFFIETDKDFNPSVFEGRPYAIIQLAADNYVIRLGEEQKAMEFFSDMAKYVEWLCGKEIRVVFAIHTHIDISAVAKLYETMDKGAMRLGTMMTGMWSLMDAHRFFRYYDEAEFVVGMRGHSVICGTGIGKPTIAIDTHPKVGGFMSEIGMSDYAIDPVKPDFLYNLQEVTNNIILRGDYDFSSIDKKREQWDNDLHTFTNNYMATLT